MYVLRPADLRPRISATWRPVGGTPFHPQLSHTPWYITYASTDDANDAASFWTDLFINVINVFIMKLVLAWTHKPIFHRSAN